MFETIRYDKYTYPSPSIFLLVWFCALLNIFDDIYACNVVIIYISLLNMYVILSERDLSHLSIMLGVRKHPEWELNTETIQHAIKK